MKKTLLTLAVLAVLCFTATLPAFAAEAVKLQKYTFNRSGLSMLLPYHKDLAAWLNPIDSKSSMEYFKKANPELKTLDTYAFSNSQYNPEIEVIYMYSKADADIFDTNLPAPLGMKFDKTELKTINNIKCRSLTLTEKTEKLNIFICRTKKEEWSVTCKYKAPAASAAKAQPAAAQTAPAPTDDLAKTAESILNSITIK